MSKYAVIPDPGWNELVISFYTKDFYTKDGEWFIQSWVQTNGEIRVDIFDQPYVVILVGGNDAGGALNKLRYMVYPTGIVVQQK